MQDKVIKNLQTTIEGETIGSLVVNYDLRVTFDYSTDVHPDSNLSNFLNEEREIEKINTVEFQIFDKAGMDITSKVLGDKRLVEILSDKVLDQISMDALEDLSPEQYRKREEAA